MIFSPMLVWVTLNLIAPFKKSRDSVSFDAATRVFEYFFLQMVEVKLDLL